MDVAPLDDAGETIPFPGQKRSPRRIAPDNALRDGESLKFEFVRDGLDCEGFVIRFQGKLAAYENRCCHLPLTLDYGDNRFFTKGGGQLVCQNHGALFEPLSGLCVRGPCQGAHLRRLSVEVKDGAIWLL